MRALAFREERLSEAATPSPKQPKTTSATSTNKIPWGPEERWNKPRATPGAICVPGPLARAPIPSHNGYVVSGFVLSCAPLYVGDVDVLLVVLVEGVHVESDR